MVLKPPKIVLFGRDGQVGTALLPGLEELGTVVPVDVGDVDLTDRKLVESFLERHSPSLIVNAAAYTNVDGAETARDLAFTLNAEAPGVMATWAAAHGAALVHYSTDYVFDGSGSKPHSEENPTAPLNVYGESKLTGDREILKSGCAHLIFRTSWVYAPRGKNFVLTMLRLGREKEELRVVNDQIGAPTSAKVVADGTVRILRSCGGDVSGRLWESGGLYNLTCRGETSWFGLAEAIFAACRARGWQLALKRLIPVGSEEYRTPAKRPKNSRLDLRKIEKQFGLVPLSWKQALDGCLNEIEK
ncbi:MAG: dTDP-4-dehydrorhamnose reductase [Pseudomonadota bacterium]